MREVEVSRFVRAGPAAVLRAMDPASVVEYEGSFSVRDIAERDGGTAVTAGGGGLRLTLWFEERDDGVRYEQREGGPLEELWTEVVAAAENEGTRVTARSGVHLGLPPAAVADRVAAWKRRGELERLLDRLAEAVE